MKTEYLLNQEVERVLAALMPSNRLVIRVCLHTGLRISDVLAMRTEDLESRMWVYERKTGKRKQIGLPGPLLDDLKAHSGMKYVFPGRSDQNKHRTRQTVWRDVKRAAKAFRIPQNVAPHSFRKVYAVDLLHRYGDIERVRRALNHSSDSLTMIYALADFNLRAKYKRRSRPGKTKA